MSGLPFTRRATPAAPTAGKDKLFFDETGELRQIGSDGVVRKPGARRLADIEDAGSLASQNANAVAITGGSAALSGALTTTGGLGYATGGGGAVTQTTSKSTSVTCDAWTCFITMNAAALANSTTVTFTLNNNKIPDAYAQLIGTHHSAGTLGGYLISARSTGAGAGSVSVRNVSGASRSEAIVLMITVVKGANS